MVDVGFLHEEGARLLGSLVRLAFLEELYSHGPVSPIFM